MRKEFNRKLHRGTPCMTAYKNLSKKYKISTRNVMIIVNDVIKPIDKQLNLLIVKALRARVRSALKYNRKIAPTMELIGCTIPELKHHIEKQFRDGMSWNNWGKFGWHLDHIRPCSSFNLIEESQQRECFNYFNLQPLWAAENWEKGKTYYK